MRLSPPDYSIELGDFIPGGDIDDSDFLGYVNGSAFSTWDNDHNGCKPSGGWWTVGCGTGPNLNAPHGEMSWEGGGGGEEEIVRAEMKIRQKNEDIAKSKC